MVLGLVIGIGLTLIVLGLWLRWKRGRARRKGLKGERIVARELQRLSHRDAVVLNSVLLPSAGGHTSQIDHVVVATTGIFVIETKSHSGRISGSEFGQYWTRHLSSQSQQFYNPLLQNKGHIRALTRILPDIPKDAFVSVVVFTDAWRLDIRADDIIEHRSLLPDRHVSRTFIPSERRKHRWWRPGAEVRLDEQIIVTPLDDLVDEIERRPDIIDRDSLREIASRIGQVAIRGKGADKAHVAYAKETSSRISQEIRSRICPRCGGDLVVRKGSNGDFVGCTNYPDCRFTCSVDRMR